MMKDEVQINKKKKTRPVLCPSLLASGPACILLWGFPKKIKYQTLAHIHAYMPKQLNKSKTSQAQPGRAQLPSKPKPYWFRP
jgi:hypothetical protein